MGMHTYLCMHTVHIYIHTYIHTYTHTSAEGERLASAACAVVDDRLAWRRAKQQGDVIGL